MHSHSADVCDDDISIPQLKVVVRFIFHLIVDLDETCSLQLVRVLICPKHTCQYMRQKHAVNTHGPYCAVNSKRRATPTPMAVGDTRLYRNNTQLL